MITAHVMIFLDYKVIGILGLFVSLLLRITYGEGDFDRIKHRGKYKVAHKEIFVEGHAVSVFYPTQEEGQMHWLRYRKTFDFTKGVGIATAWMVKKLPFSHRIF
jgi:hypothetical protein